MHKLTEENQNTKKPEVTQNVKEDEYKTFGMATEDLFQYTPLKNEQKYSRTESASDGRIRLDAFWLHAEQVLMKGHKS